MMLCGNKINKPEQFGRAGAGAGAFGVVLPAETSVRGAVRPFHSTVHDFGMRFSRPNANMRSGGMIRRRAGRRRASCATSVRANGHSVGTGDAEPGVCRRGVGCHFVDDSPARVSGEITRTYPGHKNTRSTATPGGGDHA
ncbi:hypothetical protein OG948_32355 [Embleya sp. NBC_00888]|uniref:hypothetical protein n=1 Tax=Embleya sp. NBC_00888 TaxID=2975960 RepID=UPI00386C28C4|nr:hypothetical protein OG948_32355 [Embleya sp. NBC_00888]